MFRHLTRSIYTPLFACLLPLVLLRLLIRSIKAPDYRKRWPERLGWVRRPKGLGDKVIWFHTVSVGEFIAAVPLIEQVMRVYCDHQILITTTTPTGSAQVKERFGHQLNDRVMHSYLPYDIPAFLNGLIKKFSPKLLVILETELWPNLIHCASMAGCKVVVANARLSERSAKGYAKFPKLVMPMLNRIDHLAVQSEQDAQRFEQLGMANASVSVTGSIKFDLDIDESTLGLGETMQQQWGAERPVWMMASTHKGEDEVALQAHHQVLQDHPTALLLLVPRHPERFQRVANLIEHNGLVFSRRSQSQVIGPHTQVLLIDSMGELMPFLKVAQVACMGGTFVDKGGHNPLEPAALGLPLIMGPSQFNFAQICQWLTQENALVTVQDGAALAIQLSQWFACEDERSLVGRCAKSVVAQNKGAKQALVSIIEQQL